MRIPGFLTLLWSLLFAAHAFAGTPPLYRLSGSIPAPAALWDYASIDPAVGRLYIGRFGGVLAVDLADGQVTPAILRSAVVHGVAPLPGGLAAASNGKADTVTIFDGKTGKVLAVIPAGKRPDGILYDSVLKLVMVSDSEGDALTLIDPARRVVVGTVALGGQPEAFASDGRGHAYGNLEDKNELVVVDLSVRRVTARIPLPRCREPTGLALDRLHGAVISACRNGTVDVVSTRTKKLATTLKIGAGPDAVMLDPGRGYVLIPSGSAGVLNVIRVSANGTGKLIAKIPTEVGARTGAVDPKTGNVYLPVAELNPPAHAGELPSVVPGTFRVLVYSLQAKKAQQERPPPTTRASL